ncbi:MAG: chemotaxis protein CheX [Planctomycetota bacterium]|jgi:chemotaxis protein CheX
MQVSVIQGFSLAMVETLQQMCGIDIQPGVPHAKDHSSTTYGISGVLGLSGEVQGILAITFPEEVALSVISSFTGDTYADITSDVVDGVKELANIVGGAAKTKIEAKGFKYGISLPKVVVGYNYITTPGPGTRVVIIPFKCDYGEFVLDIAIKAGA